jgi:hypothetical protein
MALTFENFSSTPAELTLQIRSQWLRNFKGSEGDAMSDMSGMSMEVEILKMQLFSSRAMKKDCGADL